MLLSVHRELGRKEKEVLQQLAEIAKEGFILKQQLIQEAKRGLEEKKVRMENEKPNCKKKKKKNDIQVSIILNFEYPMTKHVANVFLV